MVAILNYLIVMLRSMEICPLGYYVYVPQCDKPKRIHTNFKSAVIEAERLRLMFEYKNISADIQILQIIKEDKSGIPFRERVIK